ncbi:MAG: hypothetical protein WB789_04955 [Thermoplasmata archaeon]
MNALRWMFNGMAIFLAALLAVDVASNALAGTLLNVPELSLVGVFGAGVGGITYISFGMGPGATRCLWDADGFTLLYRKWKPRKFRWADPLLRIDISEITFEDKVEYDLTTRMPWHNDLTGDLYLAILTEARQRGLQVRTKTSGIPAQRIVTNRIRSAAGAQT